jgi:hypothetical protein
LELNIDGDELDGLQADLRPIRLLLVKLRKLAYKIIHSTTLILPVWRQILKDLNLDDCIMPRDVTTRWNSTFDMLNFAIKYRAAIDKITGDRTMELRRFELYDLDWEIAKQLHDTLLIFKDATLFFSRGTPNLATVIPAMDLIDKRLATDSLKRSLRRPIVAAVKIAKAAMNKYYTKTDHSETYRIAMGQSSIAHSFLDSMFSCSIRAPFTLFIHVHSSILCSPVLFALHLRCSFTFVPRFYILLFRLRSIYVVHALLHSYLYLVSLICFVSRLICFRSLVLHPRHKLAYFKKARWEHEWVETAESLVREVFNTYKEFASAPKEDSITQDVASNTQDDTVSVLDLKHSSHCHVVPGNGIAKYV